MALVVQCFIKADTLGPLFESLTQCRGVENIDLILWSDSPLGSRAEAQYIPLHAAVERLLDQFVRDWGGSFRSIQRHANPTNLGTCKTCETALNFAFVRHSFVIFSEDDCIFSRDALEWFDKVRRAESFMQEHIWSIAGEAEYFVSAVSGVPEQHIARAREAAARLHLGRYYQFRQFIPSTCFATTREKWAQFGSTRGQPLGAVDVCRRCLEEGRGTILPLVARVKDTGMLHDNGYSVFHHSKAAIADSKYTYLTSDDLGPNDALDSECFQLDDELATFLATGRGGRAALLNGDPASLDELIQVLQVDEVARINQRIEARRQAPARAYMLCNALHHRWPRTTLRMFERYRDIYPQNSWWLIGRFLALAGYGREIIAWMVELAGRRGNDVEVQACTAMVACEIKDRAIAIRYAQAALSLDPKHPTWIWLANSASDLPDS